MKLLRVHIIKSDTCDGLLDNIDINLRDIGLLQDYSQFSPLCIVGPNGAGKSQFLQVIAEIFQSIFHEIAADEERVESNKSVQFEIEYLIKPKSINDFTHVHIARKAEGKRRPKLSINKVIEGDFISCDLKTQYTLELLPRKIVGYTSGDNETLSLPFLLSRSGYADQVREHAFLEVSSQDIPDTRLMLIDYATHLEVLVANLLLGDKEQRKALLEFAGLSEIHSFRCIIQLAHSVVRSNRRQLNPLRNGIQLTHELERYLKYLQDCSTCYKVDLETETYTFDFLVDDEVRKAFRSYWETPLDLYSAFHKLSMLNDLAIPKHTRDRFKKDSKARRFASRLPEPQDEDKVFRFERVKFNAHDKDNDVDYVSLSDGEHQLAQLLGTFCMFSFSNILFLLDEPESHFNPLWRVKFISRLLDLPTSNGNRHNSHVEAAQQECLLTTHAPFVPSDMNSDNVLIFNKNKETREIEVNSPAIQTFGATFDAILAECFGIRPPISEIPRREIHDLMRSRDVDKIQEGLDNLGHSVDKVLLADRLRQLKQLKS